MSGLHVVVSVEWNAVYNLIKHSPELVNPGE